MLCAQLFFAYLTWHGGAGPPTYRACGFYGSSSMPKRRTTSANTPKQIAVVTVLAIIVGQKPIRGSRYGKIKNIGSVGTTYQKVYQA